MTVSFFERIERMDFVAAMRIMNEVGRLGSFTAAGQELGLSTASVSRIIAELEADLDVRLINRTTRQLSLTDAGEEFMQRSLGILEEIDALRSQVQERHDTPRGNLRISCVTAFGNEILAPIIPEFLYKFPELNVTVDISNRSVDLIEEHYDVAIRVGPLRDSSLIAQKIFIQRMVIVASPEFCDRFGTPASLEDLKSLPSFTQISGDWGRTHKFEHNDQVVDFEMPQTCVMSAPRAVMNAALTGHGYTIISDFSVARYIEAGRLVRLLPDYQPIEQNLYAIYVQRRYVPRKVRVFLDYLSQSLSQES